MVSSDLCSARSNKKAANREAIFARLAIGQATRAQSHLRMYVPGGKIPPSQDGAVAADVKVTSDAVSLWDDLGPF